MKVDQLDKPMFQDSCESGQSKQTLGCLQPDAKQLKHRIIEKISVCDNRPGLSVVSQEP